MGKVTGFIEFKRDKQPYRAVPERLRDWRQVMLPWPTDKLAKQGAFPDVELAAGLAETLAWFREFGVIADEPTPQERAWRGWRG